MRRIAAIAALVTGALVACPGARADGPSGSYETGDGQVVCNHDVGPSMDGVNAGDEGAGAWVFASPSGIEYCSDDERPLDGRIIVSTSAYVAADGDPDNPVQQTRGCQRVIGEGEQARGCGSDGDATR